MKKNVGYNILKEDFNYKLIFLTNISKKEESLTKITKKIKKEKYNGILILDYLLFCRKENSKDRFISINIVNGYIKEELTLPDSFYKECQVYSKNFICETSNDLLKYSFLKDEEKIEIKKKGDDNEIK